MNISDLMAKLASHFPTAFSRPETLQAWTATYASVLRDHGGKPLQDAWDATMREWDKNSPPKPADILRHCPRPAAREPEERYAGHRPLADDQLPFATEAQIRAELAEARFLEGFWLTNSYHPDAAAKGWAARERKNLILRTMGEPEEPYRPPPPRHRDPAVRDPRAIGAVLAKMRQGAS